jgi:hypothetical protein
MTNEVDNRLWELLVVEDDPICQQLLINRIKRVLPNALITRCQDTDCVIDLFDNSNLCLDAVFMDEHFMGFSTGSDMCRMIKNLFPTEAPLMVSVTSDYITRVDGEYDLYWSKPFPPLTTIRENLLRILRDRLPIRSITPEPDSD